MITIEGLTARQVVFCDLLWACDSSESVQQLITALPEQYKQEAETVLQLLAATAFDELEDVSDYVKELIRSCS